MRQIFCAVALISALTFGGDGRPPRPSAADYPVHQDTKTATIAVLRVSPEQLNKNFPADLAKKYVVVEVAIYPKDGVALDVSMMDFVLKISDAESRPETAEEVAGMWRPHNNPRPDLPGKPRVEGETGVIMERGTDPVTGRKINSVGTYERVGVSSGDDPNRPPSYPRNSSSVDSDRMEALLNNWALQEGRITNPIAGYLYFPVPLKRFKGPFELQYGSLNLPVTGFKK